MTKLQISLLLYFETRAVDFSGRVDMDRMNQADKMQAEEWNKSGLISYGRICAHDCNSDGSHAVWLTKAAWDAAHLLRIHRAERQWASRKFQTTAEKRERNPIVNGVQT